MPRPDNKKKTKQVTVSGGRVGGRPTQAPPQEALDALGLTQEEWLASFPADEVLDTTGIGLEDRVVLQKVLDRQLEVGRDLTDDEQDRIVVERLTQLTRRKMVLVEVQSSLAGKDISVQPRIDEIQAMIDLLVADLPDA